MGKSSRWMDKTRAAAKACETKMPWERGLRRQAMIARRLEDESAKSKVTLPPMPKGVFLAASA